MPTDGAAHLIDVWERRLLRILQDSELDAGTPPGEFQESPTLRQVADRLAGMTPDRYDLIANAYVAGVGPLAQTVAFGTALARVLDRLAPPDPREVNLSVSALDLEDPEDLDLPQTEDF